MFNSISPALILPLLIFLSCHVARAADNANYNDYKHRFAIESLRAGNHDVKGDNNYYFEGAIEAIKNTEEERTKEISQRQKIREDLKRFGEISLPTFTLWQQTESTEQAGMSIIIDGDIIRTLIAKAMREFNVKENEIAIRVEISLYEKNKYLFFFGENPLISSVSYFPIPPSSFEIGGRNNLKLSMSDEKGLMANFRVIYDFPINAKQDDLSASPK